MYCLECGQKIEDGQAACPNCGMSVDQIKSRIAEAQEKVTYAETIGPAETVKMPPVPERVYHDKDGNVIDPADEIDTSHADKKKNAELPVIGNEEDPYMTMPIQKIVSDDGEVLASANDDVKTFIQPPKKKKGLSIRAKAILTLVIIFSLAAIAAAFMNSAGVFQSSEIAESELVEQVNDQAPEEETSGEQTRQTDIYKTLSENYQTLGNYRGQVNTVVSNFNNYHLVSDKAKRQQYLDECNALIKQVSDSKAKLIEDMNELGLQEDNALFTCYDQINKLYELLLTRLDVIKECWDVSVASSDPKKDSAAILAPLSKDIKGGKSSSMADFDTLYPQVKFPQIDSDNAS